MIVTCGDGAKVVCVINNVEEVREFACAVSSPHARFFPHALANSRKPHAEPPETSRLTVR